MIKRLIKKRFSKFLIVGAVSTAIDFTLFFISYELIGIGIILSNIISYGAGLTNSFFINRSWTFIDGEKRSNNRLILALTFGYIGLALNTLMVWSLAFIMHVFIGKIIAVIIIILYNYFTNKHLVFLAK